MVTDLIKSYIEAQPEKKRDDMNVLHSLIQGLFSDCQLSYLDGKDGAGRIVSNPNIGYGRLLRTYADGTTREFYQIGMSANTTGISIYIMGLKDKHCLLQMFGEVIGKARITGYCIKFKRLSDIHVEVLKKAIAYALEQTRTF